MLSSLLLKIPDEYKPPAAIGIGSFMLVFLAIFHGWGLQRILHRNKRGELRLRSRRRPSLFAAALLFGYAVFLMLVLHLVEVMIWAVTLLRLGLVPRIHNAIYFCANAQLAGGCGVVPYSTDRTTGTGAWAQSGNWQRRGEAGSWRPRRSCRKLGWQD